MMTPSQTRTLRARWDQLKEEEPRLRNRRAAERLEVSEAELIASRIGDGVTRLDGDFKEIIKELPRLGPVLALTRNEYAVHEIHGPYGDITFTGPVGLVHGTPVDLRLFMTRWKFCFAVEKPFGSGLRRSLQFFETDGTAVHKIFLEEESDLDAYLDLVERYRAEDQTSPLNTFPSPGPIKEIADEEVDVDSFQRTWRELTDTHDFFAMLRDHSVQRHQAMGLAPEGYTEQVDTTSAVKVLESARDRELPIMIFVGSTGCVQIFTGRIHKLVRARGWYNILDPVFSLHLLDSAIDEAWIVRKPTDQGMVTALELFDDQGGLIGQIFGQRKPDIPEDPRWRELIESLP